MIIISNKESTSYRENKERNKQKQSMIIMDNVISDFTYLLFYIFIYSFIFNVFMHL